MYRTENDIFRLDYSKSDTWVIDTWMAYISHDCNWPDRFITSIIILASCCPTVLASCCLASVYLLIIERTIYFRQRITHLLLHGHLTNSNSTSIYKSQYNSPTKHSFLTDQELAINSNKHTFKSHANCMVCLDCFQEQRHLFVILRVPPMKCCSAGLRFTMKLLQIVINV